MPENEKAFGERLATVEQGVADLGNNLNRLATNVETLTRAVNNMNRPNWQVWLGFAAIIITLVGGENIYFRQAMTTEAHTRNAMWAEQFRVNQMFGHTCNVYIPDQPYYFPEPP